MDCGNEIFLWVWGVDAHRGVLGEVDGRLHRVESDWNPLGAAVFSLKKISRKEAIFFSKKNTVVRLFSRYMRNST